MTKEEFKRCQEVIQKAEEKAKKAEELWLGYVKYKNAGNTENANVRYRNFDYHRGYAEGLCQALCMIGVDCADVQESIQRLSKLQLLL